MFVCFEIPHYQRLVSDGIKRVSAVGIEPVKQTVASGHRLLPQSYGSLCTRSVQSFHSSGIKFVVHGVQTLFFF